MISERPSHRQQGSLHDQGPEKYQDLHGKNAAFIEKIACCTSMMHEKREHLCGYEGVAMIFNYCGHLLFD